MIFNEARPLGAKNDLENVLGAILYSGRLSSHRFQFDTKWNHASNLSRFRDLYTHIVSNPELQSVAL